jgi:hypothetical protein
MTLPNTPPTPPSPSGPLRPSDGTSGKPAVPQPQPRNGGEPPEPEALPGSGSATGFVSMLAKRQFDIDALAATPSDEAARRERLHMAREITPGGGQPATDESETTTPGPGADTPRWYAIAVPISRVLALLLLVIGAWAVGALIYMHQVSPLAAKDVHYPLIAWRFDVGPLGGYTPASRFMAWTMLLCLPVAALLLVMASLLRQRIKGRE